MATTTSFSFETLGTYVVHGFDNQSLFADNPVTVGLADGGFVTAVNSFSASTDTIFFQFSDASGQRTGRFAYNFSDPSMALLSNDRVAAVGTNRDGNLVLTTATATGTASGPHLGPGRNADIAANGSQGYAIAYESPLDNGYSVITLFIDRSNDRTDAFSINLSNLSAGPVVDRNPSVARLSNGNYVVAWDRTDASGSSDIWYGIYNQNGGIVQGPIQYDAYGLHNAKPSVAAYGTGFTITYEDDESSASTDIAVFSRNFDGRNVTYNQYDSPGNGPATDPDTTIVGALAVTSFSKGVLNGGEVVTSDVYLGLSDPRTGARLTDSDNLLLVAEYAGQASVTALGYGTGRLVVSHYDEFSGNVHQQLARLRETVTGDASNQTLYGKYEVAVTLDGGGGDDTLNEGYGDDRLLGNTGNDTLVAYSFVDAEDLSDDFFDGGAGIDTLIFEGNHYSTPKAVTASLAITGPQNTGFGIDTIRGIENLTGNAYASDRLTGNNGANVLDDGGRGAYEHASDIIKDTLIGGLGNDTYVVSDAIDIVVEAANAGTDLVRSRAASFTLSANVENLTLLAEAGNAGGSGSTGANTLTGNAGDNRLDGKAGADTMIGLRGNDTYTVDHLGDRIVEASGGGSNDRVFASLSYGLAAKQEIESLATTDAAGTGAIKLSGNELAQTLRGNDGANTLDGKGGADALYGAGGDDTYVVDDAGDRVFEAAGQGMDRVLTAVSYTLGSGQSVERLLTTSATGTANLALTGNELGQSIAGNAGGNLIDGKGGIDDLTGGSGRDVFVFSTALGAGNVDRLTDFSHADDGIRLARSIFTVLSTGSLPSSAFKNLDAAGATLDRDDRILYESDTGALYYDPDGSGAQARVQFALLVNKTLDLAANDFAVV